MGGCDYLKAKAAAVHAPLAVLNDDYYLAETNGPAQFTNANMVVVDEIDSLENSLAEFIKFSVSERQCKKYKLTPPQNMESTSEWLAWAEQAYRTLVSTYRLLEEQLPLDIARWTDIDITLNREKSQIASFCERMRFFIHEVNADWVLDIDSNTKAGWVASFKPVVVAPYCDRYLWAHGRRYLGMSGTILDPKIMATDLGIPDFEYRRLESRFPVENRLIHFRPVASLKYDRMEQELPKLLPELVKIIGEFPGENTLIHSTSNSIRKFLCDNLPGAGIDPKLIMTHDQDDRAEKLLEFKKNRGKVMISPSFDRGVDLPDGECRSVVIVKMPYAKLNDKQVKARKAMPDGQRWYDLKAIQTVMQMTGRAVRSTTQVCSIHILDAQFNSLLMRTRHLIPKWWMSAIRRA